MARARMDAIAGEDEVAQVGTTICRLGSSADPYRYDVRIARAGMVAQEAPMGLKRHFLVAAMAALVTTLGAGAASAADPRLDEADAAVQKAIGLLEAAQNPGVTPAFGGHRRKAIQDLKKARAQIAKAKQFADNPKNKPKEKANKDKDKSKGKPAKSS
jgi:hypothetical protein